MSISVFQYPSYKEFISANLAQQGRGAITRLATAIGCQRSYLSQVLHGAAQLTPDQALGIAQSFELPDVETDFFLLGVDYERAATPRLRERIERKRNVLKKRSLTVTQRVKSSLPIPQKIAEFYYSSWHYMAIHMATSSPDLQTVAALVDRLGLRPAVVEQALNRLLEVGLVGREKNRWFYQDKESLHLPQTSAWTSVNHGNWRNRAVLNSTGRTGVHYTSVFTLAAADLERLSEELLRFVERSREVVGKSSTEELAVLCCDLFRA